jgi:lysophospholipase L1-like esterase
MFRAKKNLLYAVCFFLGIVVIFASEGRTWVQSIPTSVSTQHPALFLIGDSIVHTGIGTGETGPWGWGAEFIPMFDPTKIHVYNEGLSGRSSRGYIQQGAWAKILDRLQPGDWVIVQFGHNDAANSQNYPDRTTLKEMAMRRRRSSRPQLIRKKPFTVTDGICANTSRMRKLKA